MRRIHMLLASYLLVLFMTSVSVANYMSFVPVQDAFVSFNEPDANYGFSEVLRVDLIPAPFYNERISYLKFDVSSLPYGCVINDATLELRTLSGPNDHFIRVYTVASTWTEDGITYNTRPDTASYVTCFVGNASQIEFYISGFRITAWKDAPETNHGFMLVAGTYQTDELGSREHPYMYPVLVVDYDLLPPIMEVSPAQLTFDWHPGTPNPVGTFEVYNAGGIHFQCIMTDNADWMTVSPPGIYVAPGWPSTVQAIVDYAPGCGTHVGTITLNAPDATPPQAFVTVTLNYYQAGLDISLDTIDLGWDPLGPPPSSSFDIENPGLADLEWLLSEDSDWMVCTPVSGTLGPGAVQTVTVDADNWPGAGIYTGVISITDPQADPAAVDITVTLDCYQAELAIDRDAIDLDWNPVDPEPSDSFLVQNPGTSDLIWSLTENADWLVCTPESGTVSPGEVQAVAVDIDVWPGEGTYLESITISAPGAFPEQDTVEVALTCSDMLMRLTLTPPADPVVVSPGEGFEYDALLESGLNATRLTDIWTKALLPNGNRITVWLVNNFPIGPNTSLFADDLYQSIPVTAPIGDYVFYMRAGDYPSNILAEDSFGVSVTGAARSGGADDWLAGGFGRLAGYVSETVGIVAADAAVPSEFTLGAAWPNPFNPSTTLRVNLPEAVELNVSVYNVTGQLVATLASGSYEAGSHTLTFDASHLSGGVYFVQATAGGWNDVQKVVLMK